MTISGRHRRQTEARRGRRRSKSAKVFPNWLELPREVTASILLRLGTVEILKNAQRVCTQWRSICKEPSMWTTIDIKVPDPTNMEGDLDVMCRHAVDRSCGGLVDFTIEYFGSDELLECVQIKCFRLRCCFSFFSDEALCETVAKLPLLEEVDFTINFLSGEVVEAIGSHCPRLKTLKINTENYEIELSDEDHDEEARAIAKTMPELRHLQLICNKLTNTGLEAILNGCPRLESLDLRKCLKVDLSGKLGKRCTEQIKDLKRPSDSMEGYWFSTGDDDYPYDPPSDYDWW